jgi:hypothetical protein
MKFTALFLAFASAASAATPNYTQLENYTFSQFLVDFQKEYSASELPRRQALFDAQLARVKAHNADQTQTYKQGVNKFTDMTVEEAHFWSHPRKRDPLQGPP